MSSFGEGLPGPPGHPYALALAIPGYLGYTRAAGRRDADRELRHHIVERLQLLKAALAHRGTGQNGIASTDDDTLMIDCIRRIDTLREKVDDPSSDADAFFTAPDFDEVSVEELHAYDHQIIGRIDALEKSVSGTPLGGPPLRQDWLRQLDELARLIDQREGAIGGLGQ